ncbi:MAG: glycosyltransferase [Ignavibacteriae bacterium]|nr:glycosyltransferase [Ignavibacteriota bacterium]NOG97395.1 glycosyltransferase [Ignavibacteriota bacterium]
MFEIIFLAVICIYFIETVLFIIGASKKFDTLPEDKLPSVTIVVAARNEEKNILSCLKSLNDVQYQEDKIEIVIVNDNSTDKTGELIENFIKDKPKFKMLVPDGQIGKLNGKANALALAIKNSSNEIILTTDADCIVPPKWAKKIASYYKENVALVCGYTTQKDFSAFSGMQAVDFIYLLGVAAGTINFNKPLSCIGNNMSYRRSAYNTVGGFEALPFSVTEDSQLMLKIAQLENSKVIYPLEKDALVVSEPCPDIASLFWQKKRWGVGGLDIGFRGYIIMLPSFLTHLALLISPFFYSAQVVYLIFFKIFIDFFFLYPLHKKLNLKLRFRSFITFQIYLLIYVLFLPIIIMFSKNVKWKERLFN